MILPPIKVSGGTGNKNQRRRRESRDDSNIKHKKSVASGNKKSARRVSSCPSIETNYTYRVLPGNNTRVVLNVLRRRQWWLAYNEAKPTCNFIWEMYRNPSRYKTRKYKRVLLNHLQNNACLVSKKGIYESLRSYCSQTGCDMSTVVPRTFFIQRPGSCADENNSELSEFLEYSENMSSGDHSGIWILKPSSCSNRGCGIVVVRGTQKVLECIGMSNSHNQEEDSPVSAGKEIDPSRRRLQRSRGWIVQEYMERPLLISGRKFDVRCFVLLVLRDGDLRAYLYEEGYVRTSCRRYNLKDLSDRETHLTNDAVQKKSAAYGKHENGNKLNYEEWQTVIDRDYPDAPPGVVHNVILPQILRQTTISIRATRDRLSQSDIRKSFELLGYDYMVDSEYRSTLIEVNSNPCLEFSCPMLERLLPEMMENVFQIAVDGLLPPPAEKMRTKLAQSTVDSIAQQQNRFQELDISDAIL